tara:strand:- start:14037 stop:14234 length:198 start_codon:yes stop_codon:yes gene_type:complete
MNNTIDDIEYYDYDNTIFCSIILGICLLCIIIYFYGCAKVYYDSTIKHPLLYVDSDEETYEGDNV